MRWSILQRGERKYNVKEEVSLSCSSECQYNSDKQDSRSMKETYSELLSKKTYADRLCDLQPAEFL